MLDCGWFAGAVMSEISRWVYTNTAAVKPFVSIDSWTGQVTYGPEFEIACTWTAEATQQRDQVGSEFVSKYVFFTEDPRPKYLDMIKRNGHDDWDEIRAVTEWDMSPFGDTPDFRLVT